MNETEIESSERIVAEAVRHGTKVTARLIRGSGGLDRAIEAGCEAAARYAATQTAFQGGKR